VKVQLLRYTEGGVDLIAESARVSGVPEDLSSREIVRMIVENDYSSALEHISFTFDLSGISIALSRELLEHRIASHTARSTRYNEEADFSYYLPREVQDRPEAQTAYRRAMAQANQAFQTLRRMGVSRESARYLLPLGTHTHYIWTVNARSLINFLGLRLCVRAAPEIRALAREIHGIVVGLYPEIFETIDCRGYHLGLCPENEVRNSPQGRGCPYKNPKNRGTFPAKPGSRGYIPTKKELKEAPRSGRGAREQR
jgi:thymidylate synthase (FAD)